MICNFLLMMNSNRGRITYTVCKIIIAYRGRVEIANFAYSTLILDPGNNTYVIYSVSQKKSPQVNLNFFIFFTNG